MIKLFLITLLCMAMFVDSQEDQMNEMGTGRKASADIARHAMMGQGSPLLMQYAARNRGLQGRGLQGGSQGGPQRDGPAGGGPPRGGPPRGPPPEGSQENGSQGE
ncbi:PREDICTED: uncharacterized protein LOC108758120 [Trachymyrmex cornetzi]|uniref:Uncharacterized protein n=1 Tax=Trachymyrmex cornetzi TaxID=471704 RepID=A0A151JLN3_9HYME|nr:PREDICTED: uncharacterized protein LOC108758120 [Trachymyrmex cornetzi]KYN26711.1 hypothetical protein ALC57_03937 [Trachymyrmex cornetzi]